LGGGREPLIQTLSEEGGKQTLKQWRGIEVGEREQRGEKATGEKEKATGERERVKTDRERREGRRKRKGKKRMRKGCRYLGLEAPCSGTILGVENC